MVMLNRKFTAPEKRDSEQWAKVKRLVDHGFYFFSVYRTGENGGKNRVPYPTRLSEVSDFVTEFREQSALSNRFGSRAGKNSTSPPGDA
jgi:hypothetical protein